MRLEKGLAGWLLKQNSSTLKASGGTCIFLYALFTDAVTSSASVTWNGAVNSERCPARGVEGISRNLCEGTIPEELRKITKKFSQDNR